MRKTSIVDDNIHLFPYANVRIGEEVVLYGFGKVGHNYYNQIIANGYCKIRYIVDQNWEKYAKEGFPVRFPECLKDEKDAKIVIALAKKPKQVLELLNSYGIDSTRIVFNDTFMGNPVDLNHSKIIERCEMTGSEAIDQYGSAVYEKMKHIRNLLRLGGVEGKGYVRIGTVNDGGYVMIDDFDRKQEGIAYSFGIFNDVSWDDDMADRGYDIYMYDHTIDCLPKERNAFHFFERGIADSDEPEEKLGTLEEYIRLNGHQDEEHMILKMDVEGAEWGFLNMVMPETLSRFDQIVMELHFMLDQERLDKIEKALEKLTDSHRLVHVHANNTGSVTYVDGAAYPDALEVTFVKRGLYQECEHDKELPFELDSPCWREYPDLALGRWNI